MYANECSTVTLDKIGLKIIDPIRNKALGLDKLIISDLMVPIPYQEDNPYAPDWGIKGIIHPESLDPSLNSHIIREFFPEELGNFLLTVTGLDNDSYVRPFLIREDYNLFYVNLWRDTRITYLFQITKLTRI